MATGRAAPVRVATISALLRLPPSWRTQRWQAARPRQSMRPGPRASRARLLPDGLVGAIRGARHILSKKLDLNTYAENEHQEFIIEGDFKLKIIQIAGMVARRTVSLVREMQQVEKGQDLGLIRFGSQVTLIMPKLELKVKEGDKVKAGQTIIATY